MKFLSNLVSFILKLNPVAIVFGVLLIAMMTVLVPRYKNILSYFGYDTREVLKEKLIQANQNTQVAVDANKSQESAIKINEGTIKHTDEAIRTVVDNDKKINRAVERFSQKAQEKIKKIEQSDLLPVEKEKAIDAEFIDTLWRTYCSFSIEDSQCDKIETLEPQEN